MNAWFTEQRVEGGKKHGGSRKKLTKGILLDNLNKDLHSSHKKTPNSNQANQLISTLQDKRIYFAIYLIPKKQIENFSFILKPESKTIINQPKNLYFKETMTYEPNEY